MGFTEGEEKRVSEVTPTRPTLRASTRSEMLASSNGSIFRRALSWVKDVADVGQKMYIFLVKGVDLATAAKVASEAASSAVKRYESDDPQQLRAWYTDGAQKEVHYVDSESDLDVAVDFAADFDLLCTVLGGGPKPRLAVCFISQKRRGKAILNGLNMNSNQEE